MVTAADMALRKHLVPFSTPDDVPLTFTYGGRAIRGIPAEFNPQVRQLRPDTNLDMWVVEGTDAAGLNLRAECVEYRDFPVTEWVAYLTNTGAMPTPIISDLRILDREFTGTDPHLVHGTGDNCQPTGYEVMSSRLADGPVTTHPYDHSGTPCCGASPYLRLRFEEYEVRVAVGWPAQWTATATVTASGAHLSVGQQRCHMSIAPGETMRTPRVNLMGALGDATRSTNLWRQWYLQHILPREDGQAIPPKLCLHVWNEGGPEFSGATEAQQLAGIDTYVARGLAPDIWWIDAGWYKCDLNWPYTGTWTHDTERFPRGLRPVGEKCDEIGARLLLWFEPERVHHGTWLAQEHPEWILYRTGESATDHNGLLNLALPEVQDWLIDHVDALIKEYRVGVYRQDFNYDPMPNWVANEAANRIGALENLHVQGYLRYWDALLHRNPGLWIDSCASGGRRNELETMRRAVPLHYTDVGYGEHPIKQKQHRFMFEWIPYFRAHNMNWCDANGAYGNGSFVADRYSYHCALAPSLTDMTDRNASEEAMALAREMTAIWRHAAELMLRADYYPLTECRQSPADYYAMQFEDPTRGDGLVQVVRNSQCDQATYLAPVRAEAGYRYHFTQAETGDQFDMDGAALQQGLAVALAPRSGALWFYTKSPLAPTT